MSKIDLACFNVGRKLTIIFEWTNARQWNYSFTEKMAHFPGKGTRFIVYCLFLYDLS